MNHDEYNDQNKQSETDIPQELPRQTEDAVPVAEETTGIPAAKSEATEEKLSEENTTAEETSEQPKELPSASYSPTQPPQNKKPKKDHTLAIILGVLAVFALMFFIILSGTLLMIAQFFANVKENRPDFPESSQIVSEDPENSLLPGEDQSENSSNGGETFRYENKYDINGWVKEEDLNNDQPIVNVAAKCSPSVVTVKTDGGAGSGVIWTTDGYIVTNNHVIDGYKNAVVTLVNGAEYPAVVIGTDPSTDLALLRIAVTGLLPAELRGDDKTIMVGETVVAIGNPLGTLANSVSKGIISALNRKITVEGVEMTLTQIDASVNPGNSGGGCFDIYGNLIGIVNAKSVDEDLEGLGYAIPLSTVKKVITNMIKGDTTKIKKSLGITGIFISESEYAKLQEDKMLSELLSAYEQRNGAPVYGILVTDDKQTVYTNTNNAFKTGIGTVSGQNKIVYTYDVILSIDGVAIESAEQLNDLLNQKYKANDVIKAEVCRIGLNYTSSIFGSTSYNGCTDIEKLTVEIKVVEMYR